VAFLLVDAGAAVKGHVRVEGSKNATLPMMAASILVDEPVILQNACHANDIVEMARLLESLGKRIAFSKDSLRITGEVSSDASIDSRQASKIRYSLLLLGSMLAKTGQTKIPLPGGCRIGLRKFDIHLDGLSRLGARFQPFDGWISGSTSGLKGTDIALRFPTMTGTENLLLAATLARGRTRIFNACVDPEISDFIAFLNSMGARIRRSGSTIEVEGVNELGGSAYEVMGDRVEAITYVAAAGVSRGSVTISGVRTAHFQAVAQKLREIGFRIFESGGRVEFEAPDRAEGFEAVARSDPLIHSDFQPFLTVIASLAKARSVITDLLFDNRFAYVPELRKMGARIRIRQSHSLLPNGKKAKYAIVDGVERLHGAKMTATDLRGGASLVVAAVGAEGRSLVGNIEEIERGYYRLDEKLSGLGARIRKI